MTQLWISRTLLAALAAALGLALSSTSAQAQFCGDPEDAPDDLAEAYSLGIEDFVPQDAATCSKWGLNFLSICQDTVRAAAQCLRKQFAAFTKAAKPICKAEGGDCNHDLKEEQEQAEDDVDEQEAEGLADCEVQALGLAGFCLEPF
jgi:hypothetical protein